MTTSLRICMAQLNLHIGDIAGNLKKHLSAIAKAAGKADVIIFPELSITGYPPEDLLLRDDFHRLVEDALQQLCKHSHEIDVVVGYPKQETGSVIYNAAAWLQGGKIVAEHIKNKLPNYGVFDEKRYFTTGKQATVVNCKGYQVGLLICEDLWFPEPTAAAKTAGAELILSANASPFSIGRAQQREAMLAERCSESGLPILYVNQILGQDDLLFDGASVAMNSNSQVVFQGRAFEEALYFLNFDRQQQFSVTSPAPAKQSELEMIYAALVQGVRDYISKNNFPGIVLGLSGGIDSGLSLAIAVDALGADRVQAIMMPSQYTADMSQEDAKAQAEMLGVDYHTIAIGEIFKSFKQELSPLFKGLKEDTTEENLQARIRGTLLMAVSNKTGKMVLTTGNKSEMAVGYATLYGDMAGGYCALKDVYKTLVYQLAEYRNSVSPAIPQRVIDRPPSAELAPDQKDEDSLPPYDVLDRIIEAFVEDDLGVDAICQLGFDKETVAHVIRLIKRSEYKRQQAAPGPRITKRAFGRNRRYPISSGF